MTEWAFTLKCSHLPRVHLDIRQVDRHFRSTKRTPIFSGMVWYLFGSLRCDAFNELDAPVRSHSRPSSSCLTDSKRRIVFRALQGLGGSGVFSVVFVTIVDICPARLLGPYSATVSSTFALANILGPLVGGAISDNRDWKWIFLLK